MTEESGFAGTDAPTAWERLWLLLRAPDHAFRGVDRGISWLYPILVVSLLIAGAPHVLHRLHIDEQREGIGRLLDDGLLTEEQAQNAWTRLDEALESRSAGKIAIQMLLAIATQFLIRFVFPAALLLIGVRFVMEGKARFVAVLGALGWASVPAGIRILIRTPFCALQGSLDIYFGPAALPGVDPDTVGGYALTLLDVFDIWILALLITGISSVGGLSRGRAAGLVLPLWLVYSLARIGMKSSPFGAAL